MDDVHWRVLMLTEFNLRILRVLQFVLVNIAVFCDVNSGISVPTPEKRILLHLHQGDVDVPLLVSKLDP
jgi:hypothetical protein